MKMAKSTSSKIANKSKMTAASKSLIKRKYKDLSVTPATAATVVAQRSDENYVLLVFSHFSKFCCSPIRFFLLTYVFTWIGIL